MNRVDGGEGARERAAATLAAAAALAVQSGELLAWAAELRGWRVELQAKRSALSSESALLWWSLQISHRGLLAPYFSSSRCTNP